MPDKQRNMEEKERKSFHAYAAGIVLTIVMALVAWLEPGFLETLELKLLDLRFAIRGVQDHNRDVVIVTVDDSSLARLGKWPWSRTVFARLVDTLHQAGASVVAFDVFFQKDPGEAVGKDTLEFAESIRRAGIVVLPAFFNLNKREKGHFPADYPFNNFAYGVVRNLELLEGSVKVTGYDMYTSAEALNAAAAGVGHINGFPDNDGITRKEVLALKYDDSFYPAMSLRAVQRYWGKESSELELRGGEGVVIGDRLLPVTPMVTGGVAVWGTKVINYRGGYRTFDYYSVADVLEQRFSAGAFKGKIVLVGATSPGLYDVIATPFANIYPGVEKNATVIDNILQNDFISRPPNSNMFSALACLVLGATLTFVLPRASLFWGVFAVGAVSIAASAAAYQAFSQYTLWLTMVYPLLTTWSVVALVMAVSYLRAKREHVKVVEESHETTVKLALAYQGKGLLEMAYQSLAKLPLQPEYMHLFYNLGIELERKRKAALAVTVYKRLYEKDNRFEDVAQRLKSLGASISETPVIPDSATVSLTARDEESGQAATLLPGQTLGRYEVIKLLGKGSMGAVYLAKDPTIDRLVAIKTFYFAPYADEQDPEALSKAFLREARLAGGLSHPNIVTVFDAGEDWDLSYIAMEVLQGTELRKYSSPDNLLPLPRVVEIISFVALALDYAHANGVIHRDIKPANIMVLTSGVVKLTDFGVAMVLGEFANLAGTPAYMAPEQISGWPVDGRTDLYSLGVVFFELLTGQKPFADTDFHRLREKILHDPVPDLAELVSGVPKELQQVVERLLQKDPAKRFAKGREVAAALQGFYDDQTKLTSELSETVAPGSYNEATVITGR